MKLCHPLNAGGKPERLKRLHNYVAIRNVTWLYKRWKLVWEGRAGAHSQNTKNNYWEERQQEKQTPSVHVKHIFDRLDADCRTTAGAFRRCPGSIRRRGATEPFAHAIAIDHRKRSQRRSVSYGVPSHLVNEATHKAETVTHQRTHIHPSIRTTTVLPPQSLWVPLTIPPPPTPPLPTRESASPRKTGKRG